MKRIWGHVLSLCIAGLAVSAAMPGCANNDQTIFIHGALHPSANRQNGSCIYTADPQQNGLFSGSLDVSLVDSYISVLLVGNQLIPRGDPMNNRAESNRIHINGGVVRVTETDGTLIREFTSASTGFADPQNNNTPGFDSIALITLDAPTKDILLNKDNLHPEQPGLPTRSAVKSVLLNIKVFGKSLGEVDVESDEFQFPLEVCNGCLIDFSTGNDPLQTPHPNCAKSDTGGVATMTMPPCFRGQDEFIRCQDCLVNKSCNTPLSIPFF